MVPEYLQQQNYHVQHYVGSQEEGGDGYTTGGMCVRWNRLGAYCDEELSHNIEITPNYINLRVAAISLKVPRKATLRLRAVQQNNQPNLSRLGM